MRETVSMQLYHCGVDIITAPQLEYQLKNVKDVINLQVTAQD